MGLMDKFLDSLHLGEDEYDFDNEDFDMEEEPAKPAKAPKKDRVKEKEDTKANVVSFAEKETTRQEDRSRRFEPAKKTRTTSSGMGVCVIKPTCIEDEMEITTTLLNGRTVIINMEGLNVEIAQRIIDFVSGAAFAMNGSLQKISNYIFLATPSGVDISGDIQDLMNSFDVNSHDMRF